MFILRLFRAQKPASTSWLRTFSAAISRCRSASSYSPMGFSVLRLIKETGDYVCDIYLPRQPSRVQDRATASLGHEMAHCLGFSHE